MSNLKLYLTALLATFYTVVWWTLGLRLPRAATTEGPEVESVPGNGVGAGSMAWYQDLAPADRPPLHLPPGWRLASPSSPSAVAPQDAPPVPVRVAPARAPRIRTRSS
jgi:hypothetical protein